MKTRRTVPPIHPEKARHPVPAALLLSCLLTALGLAVFSGGCGPKKMTLDEAVRTTMSLRGKAFVPPPRSIDDILGVIQPASRQDGSITNQWTRLMEAAPPEHASRQERVAFYTNRADAVLQLGHCGQCAADIKTAYDLAMPEKFDPRIISIWAACELNLQNYRRAITLYNILKDRGQRKFMPYAQLVYIHALTGQFEDAERVRNEALAVFRERNPRLNANEEIFKARLDYHVLNMQARYQEAEPFMRQAIAAAAAVRPLKPVLLQTERIRLVRNLIDQNRLVEAELEARATIRDSIRLLGAESHNLLAANTNFAEVLLAQGRFDDAEKVARAALQGYERTDLPPTFGWWSRSVETLCKTLVAKGDYVGALAQFEFFRRLKESDPYIYDAFYANDRNAMLTLVMTGRLEEAMALITEAHRKSVHLLGEDHSQSAELLALRGMANNSTGQHERAYLDFSEAIPVIVRSKTYVANRLAGHRFQLILESYLSLLSTLRGSLTEKRLAFSAPVKAFEVSMLLGDRAVQAAILESAARMSIDDPGLKELVRTEQDVQQRITAYQNLIQSLLAKPFDEIDHQAVGNIKDQLDKLNAARATIVAEVERRFPDYASLVDTRQPSVEEIQDRLRPDEIMIAISSTEKRTCVFAVPPSGPPQMVALEVSKATLEELVSGVKSSLSPTTPFLGRLPLYDFEKAHALYALLLKPLEDAWKSSRHLIFVKSGPLGRIPFSILTTRPFQLENEEEVLFSSYRKAPWLIHRVSSSTVPSAGAFVALRAHQRMRAAKEAFAGFGDPLFSKVKMGKAEEGGKKLGVREGGEGAVLDVRGIRVTDEGSLDDKAIVSCKIESLVRLPDTADEILALSAALGADPARDVFLGRQASERQVKSMDLTNRRIVAFASHALVPYDLDGLDQPAIALSAPSVTGEPDDGLLTLAEILDLKLNAEWVVLSACNTGAAQGAGAEAVSGLGRAFFYAGTRAVLVSMWPVETGSARSLTTSLFRHMEENPGLDKAAALRAAMLELIQGPGMRDGQGRVVASYAHPFFWAPFIVVGDPETRQAE